MKAELVGKHDWFWRQLAEAREALASLPPWMRKSKEAPMYNRVARWEVGGALQAALEYLIARAQERPTLRKAHGMTKAECVALLETLNAAEARAATAETALVEARATLIYYTSGASSDGGLRAIEAVATIDVLAAAGGAAPEGET